MIIDEEQRFGVGTEALKMRVNVDVLSMSDPDPEP